MASAGAFPASRCAPVCGELARRSNVDWMARTGCASGAVTCRWWPAAPHRGPQVLPAYGLQDSRTEEPNRKTKSNPNTMCLPITPGENHGGGHFYLAENRTFLLCVDTPRIALCQTSLEMSPSLPH